MELLLPPLVRLGVGVLIESRSGEAFGKVLRAWRLGQAVSGHHIHDGVFDAFGALEAGQQIR